jgi:cytochrome b6-f complex iron-sulfur subunit
MKNPIPRRNFLNQLLFGWFGLTLVPAALSVVKYLIPPKVADMFMRNFPAGKLSQLAPDSAKIIKYNKKPIIVLHEADGELKAFSAICPHLGCTVKYEEEKKQFHCYCHDSLFDLNGKNIGGPAQKPMTPLVVAVKNDDISVSDI